LSRLWRSEASPRAGEIKTDALLRVVKCMRRLGMLVSDRSKKRDSIECPRCGARMEEVVSIAPIHNEPGLVGYECPSCRYVTSVLQQPQKQE
jgi:DNA-directed RNA polymerase subunit RPC12/RpoP